MEQAAYLNDTGHSDTEKKQAMLAAIIDSSDDAIISKTLEGIITSWNYAAEHLFGYVEAEVIGKHISLLIPADRQQEENMIIDRIRKGLRVEHFETLRQSKSGELIPISLTVSPIKGNDGTLIGASKIARDISDQVRSRNEIRKHAQNLELLLAVGKTISEKLDLHPILQSVTDITTRLTGAEFGAFFYNNVNEKGENYLLYTLSGAPKSAFEAFDMPRKTELFKPTFNGEGILRSDDITRDPRYGKNSPNNGMPEGHLPVVSYLAVPLVSATGSTIGGLFFGHSRPAMFLPEHEKLLASIAAQAAVAIDNAKLYEDIKTLNALKDEFIGVAGHELRTPITTIKGYLQLLEDHAETEVAKDFLGKALRQVNKLNRLISDLLDVTKIQAGKLEYNFVACRLLPLVRETAETINQINLSHSIECILPSEDLVIMADGAKIEQVLINFLNNAVKYSPAADKIILTVKKEERRVVISVRDFGIGIPEQQLQNIFQRYYRVDPAISISGLGIGLYISKEIIDRHGGAVWVESREGEGSIFYFSMPLPE